MKLITVAGPPSSGKTSVILRLVEALQTNPKEIGVRTGYSGKFCPDHSCRLRYRQPFRRQYAPKIRNEYETEELGTGRWLKTTWV